MLNPTRSWYLEFFTIAKFDSAPFQSILEICILKKLCALAQANALLEQTLNQNRVNFANFGGYESSFIRTELLQTDLKFELMKPIYLLHVCGALT